MMISIWWFWLATVFYTLIYAIAYKTVKDLNKWREDCLEDKSYYMQLYRCELVRNQKLVRKVKHLESNIKNCLRNI